jgi:hypothetical protein
MQHSTFLISICSYFSVVLTTGFMSETNNNKNTSKNALQNTNSIVSGMIVSYKQTPNSEEIELEPIIIYGGRSTKQIRKYQSVPGAAKREPGKRLPLKPFPEDKAIDPNSVFVDRDGVKIFPDGTNFYPDGTQVWANGTTIYHDRMTVQDDGVTIYPDGTMVAPDGSVVEIQQQIMNPDGTITDM